MGTVYTGKLPPPLPPLKPWPDWTHEFDPKLLRLSFYWGLFGVFVFALFSVCTAVVVPWERLLPEPSLVEKGTLEIELVVEEPEGADRFVEPNPAVPPEVLDKPTPQYGAQDQVAAQEASEELSDSSVPLLEGETEETQKIVSGNIAAQASAFYPEEIAEERNVNEGEPTETNGAASEQVGVPEGSAAGVPIVAIFTDEDVIPSQVPDEPAAEDESTTEEEVAETEPELEYESNRAQFDGESEDFVVVLEPVVGVPEGGEPARRAVPRPRPRISFRTPPGPIKENPYAAGRLGVLAVDSRFSEFGAYQQRMIESISAQWHLLGENFFYSSKDIGTRVAIVMVINSQGEITEFSVVATTASESATLLVQDAILSRAPFGLWTEDMLRVLGDEEEMRMNFNYR